MNADPCYVLAVCSEGPPPHYYVIHRCTHGIESVHRTYSKAKAAKDKLNQGQGRDQEPGR